MTTVSRRLAIGLVVAAYGLSDGGAGGAGSTGPAGPGPPLRRGMNFHHVLNWPEMSAPGNYVWPPFTGASFQTSDGELAALKAKGFDFLRLTLDPAILMASAPLLRDQLIDIVLGRAQRFIHAGFSVVVDLHPVAQNPRFAPGQLMSDGDAFKAYSRMTQALAKALARLDPMKVALELFNEPPLWRPEGQVHWRAMQAGLHDVARQAAGDALPIVLTGADWSSYRALLSLDVDRYRNSNVYYTFHYYEPHIFTHQGVQKEQERYVENLVWPPAPAQRTSAVQKAKLLIDRDSGLSPDGKLAASLTTERLLNSYFDGGSDAEGVEAVFARIGDWARARRIASSRVLLGEFGAALQPGASAEVGASRLAWLRAVRSAAELNGFPWAYWAYRGKGGMSLATEGSAAEIDTGVLKALGLST
ncbi:glycoside hydrolase family 5 protein [Caulobacter sp. DWP3-1-3b2]|uniref:glycoside hydrolase family 5 protein n=1 Tax=Caulobacter sp. DWP3-1-3b2 TaxID=2804643 RepID=UPI003CF3E3C5